MIIKQKDYKELGKFQMGRSNTKAGRLDKLPVYFFIEEKNKLHMNSHGKSIMISRRVHLVCTPLSVCSLSLAWKVNQTGIFYLILSDGLDKIRSSVILLASCYACFFAGQKDDDRMKGKTHFFKH